MATSEAASTNVGESGADCVPVVAVVPTDTHQVSEWHGTADGAGPTPRLPGCSASRRVRRATLDIRGRSHREAIMPGLRGKGNSLPRPGENNGPARPTRSLARRSCNDPCCMIRVIRVIRCQCISSSSLSFGVKDENVPRLALT